MDNEKEKTKGMLLGASTAFFASAFVIILSGKKASGSYSLLAAAGAPLLLQANTIKTEQ